MCWFYIERCLRLLCRTYTDISLFKDTEYNNSELNIYKHLLSLRTFAVYRLLKCPHLDNQGAVLTRL